MKGLPVNVELRKILITKDSFSGKLPRDPDKTASVTSLPIGLFDIFSSVRADIMLSLNCNAAMSFV